MKITKKSNNVGVERGVVTGRAQMVSPMMTVTVTNLRASLGSNFKNMWNLGHFCKFFKIAA